MIRKRILFVCTVNRMRSATAHKIYENDERFEVDSAGTDRTANVVLEEWHLEWADAIVVRFRVKPGMTTGTRSASGFRSDMRRSRSCACTSRTSTTTCNRS